MRILYLNEHPVWLYGLPCGFRHLGHDVMIVKKVEKESLGAVMESFKPELLITVGWVHEYMRAEKRTLIKKMARSFHCLHVYWATEDITWFKKWSLPMVKAVRPNVVFTINADCIPLYQKQGFPAFHLDFGYNPAFVKDSAEEQEEKTAKVDLVLVANSYQVWRYPQYFRWKSIEMLLKPLAERKYEVLVAGGGWSTAPWENPHNNVRYIGAVPFEDTFRLYGLGKIVLNLQNQNQYPTQVTSRTFEIMGSGAFELTSRTPAVEQLFIHRRHLVMSGSAEETLALVDYYLAHEKERQEVAANGQAEILAKHTYDKRAADLLFCLNQV